MFDPELVAKICQQMIYSVNIPVTVKCRLGVDDHDTWEHFVNFIDIVSNKGGVNKFILHARKAFLKGLDPKQNRNIPPLKYDWVLRIK
jgi:tRNA-dihydrouridine synthase A